VYEQRLRILDKFASLRRTRLDVAQTMIIPDVSQPGSSFFFEKIPLSVSWQGENPEEPFEPAPLLNEKVCLWTGDVTVLECGAIAVPTMWNFEPEGAGLSGNVYLKGGLSVKRDCLEHGIVECGQTVVTKGYDLPCQFVFHTAPPSFRRIQNQYDMLQSCYETCFAVLVEQGVRTIAFTCLGTGSKFNQPKVDAAHIALKTARRWLEAPGHAELVDRVAFVVKNARQEEIYEQLLKVYFPVTTRATPPAPALLDDDSSQQVLEDLLSQLPTPPQ